MSFRSYAGALASLPAESVTAAAAPTRLPRAFAVQVSPSALAQNARAGRTVASGTFPCWLVQTDGRGVEKCRMLVQSAAPIYLAGSTGDAWYILAGAQTAASADAAFDVTAGDDPGDWLEVAPAAVASGLLSSGEVAIPNATLVATTLEVVAPPAARQIVVDLWCPSKFNTPAQANLNVSWQRLVAGQFVEQKLNGLALGGATERMTAIARLGSATSGVIFPGSAGALLFYDSAPPFGTHRFAVSPASGQTQSAMIISWAVFS